MTNITTAISNELKIAEEIAKKSRLTEGDAEEIGRKIKKEIARRHGLIKK